MRFYILAEESFHALAVDFQLTLAVALKHGLVRLNLRQL